MRCPEAQVLMRRPRRQIPSPKRSEAKLGLEKMRAKISPINPALLLQRYIVFMKEELGIFF
jgi:hypothetical protein